MFIITLAADWCILKRQFTPRAGFMVTTVSRGWRDGEDRLAITNKQHEPNRYPKASLIEDNMCKLSV